MPSHFAIWMGAARPKTLWAAVGPVAMASAMAFRDGGFDALTAVVCLAVAMLLQVATNFCNDYCDHQRGADTAERRGPVRATAAGLVKPETMRTASALTFGLAALAAVYLVQRGGWILAPLMALAIASGVLYTAGPKPLGYIGMGDLFVLVFFGPVAVAGTYYVQALRFSEAALLAGLAPGLLSVAILVVNNLRDREGDARSGKRTLAVRFGPTFTRWEYTVCVLGALAVPPALVRFYAAPATCSLASLVAVGAIAPLRTIWTTENPASLNKLLAFTALLLIAFSSLFSMGYLL